MFLQHLALKLGVASGRDLAQACRDAYPRWGRVECMLTSAAVDHTAFHAAHQAVQQEAAVTQRLCLLMVCSIFARYCHRCMLDVQLGVLLLSRLLNMSCM